jgi:protein tyrosine/serine phosphatase
MKHSFILIFTILIFLACTRQVPEDVDEKYIPPAASVVDKQFNFHIAASGIWRSSQPNKESIIRMRGHGLKSIINLRGDKETDNWESKLSDSLGINYFSRPIDSREKQDLDYLKGILALAEDSTNQPALIHCLGGKDRTGLIVGMYKLKYSTLPLSEIKKEMIMYGHDNEELPEIFNSLEAYASEIRKKSQ